MHLKIRKKEGLFIKLSDVHSRIVLIFEDVYEVAC